MRIRVLIIFSSSATAPPRDFPAQGSMPVSRELGRLPPTLGAGHPATWAAPHLGLQVPQADNGFLVLAGGFVVAAQFEEPVPFSVEDGHRLHLLLVVQAPRLPLVLARGLHLAQQRRWVRRGPRDLRSRSWGPASSAFSTSMLACGHRSPSTPRRIPWCGSERSPGQEEEYPGLRQNSHHRWWGYPPGSAHHTPSRCRDPRATPMLPALTPAPRTPSHWLSCLAAVQDLRAWLTEDLDLRPQTLPLRYPGKLT